VPEGSGAGGQDRTDDILITNQVLYQLSYAGPLLSAYQASHGRLAASIQVMLFAAATAAALLTPGVLLPPLEGEFLTGRKAVLPQAANGKSALLVLGFTYQSRYRVEDWVRRFRADFGSDPAVTFFEIPVIGGMARLGKWFIDSGMRSGTPAADHEHVITVYGGADAWKQRVGFGPPDDAYLILTGPDGRVRWLHHGPFEPGAYNELVSALKGTS
jgi:hypothetical protein